MKFVQGAWRFVFGLGVIVGVPLYSEVSMNPNPVSHSQIEAERAAGAELMVCWKETIRSGGSHFVVAKGVYRVGYEGKDVYLFSAKGISNLQIEGNGALVVVENIRKGAFYFESCARVSMKNLSFDYDPLPYLQGEIRKIDAEANAFEVRLDPGSLRPGNEELLEVKNLHCFYEYDGKTKLIKSNVMECAPESIAKIGDNLFRVKVRTWDKAPLAEAGSEVGDGVVLVPRFEPVLASFFCRDIVFENLTLYAGPGLCVYERKCESRSIYKNIKILRRPGRLLSCNADGIHSSMSKVGPLIADCEVEGGGDDAYAAHGFFSVVLKKSEPRRFILAPLLYRDFETGSKLDFFDPKTLGFLGTAKVVSWKRLEDPAFYAEAKKIPAEIVRETGLRVMRLLALDVLEVEIDWDLPVDRLGLVTAESYTSAGAIVERCSARNIRGRGICLNTTDAEIRDNRISWTSLPSIIVGMDFPWVQGPAAKNITIERNLCRDACVARTSRMEYMTTLGAISIYSYYSGKLRPSILNENIQIRSNQVLGSGSAGIFAMNTRGLQIEGNLLSDCLRGAPHGLGKNLGLESPYYAVLLASVSDFKLVGNSVSDPGRFSRGELGVFGVVSDKVVRIKTD